MPGLEVRPRSALSHFDRRAHSVADAARLTALADLSILDTAPEAAFDRFTRLAADLLDVPVALICLVDGDRQFFKSHYGLPQPWAQARQSPLSHAICQHVVASKLPLIVEDARHPALVADNVAVRDLSVQAYAGIPLVLEDGSAVGAFCAIDARPRRWHPRELHILEDLAAAVKTLLDLRCSVAEQGQRDRLTGLPNRGLRAAYGQLGGALRGAVARGEVTVVFQPIVEISSGRTRAFEALARWNHPDLGCVAPSEFIPVAEAGGEIALIGEHVLRSACKQLAGWRGQSGLDLQVTVNLSPVQLGVPSLADVVRDILVESGLPGHALALEITEGVLMTPDFVTRHNLERIRELGIHIALDDFGTGYSALSYLKSFPVDVIKADRSFLDGLGSDRRGLAVLRAILAIGDGMDIQVVAEGVETQRQRELLRLSGCPLGQGFLFSRPLPAEEIHLGGRPFCTRPIAAALPA
ncbi:MAG: EAL domain-containing protein [Solirubrobacteraceae bacterium]